MPDTQVERISQLDIGDGKRYEFAGANDAADVGYDNTESGLEADNVQDAVDDIVNNLDKFHDTVTYGSSELRQLITITTPVDLNATYTLESIFTKLSNGSFWCGYVRSASNKSSLGDVDGVLVVEKCDSNFGFLQFYNNLGRKYIARYTNGTFSGWSNPLDTEETKQIGVYLQIATDSVASTFSTISGGAKSVTAYRIAPKIYALETTIFPNNASYSTILYQIIFGNNGNETSNIQILNLDVFARNATVTGTGIQIQHTSGQNRAFIRNEHGNGNWLPSAWNGTSDMVQVRAIIRIL